MYGYFSGVSFPYPNMQQLNLDWIMQRVGQTPPIVQLPALATGWLRTDIGPIIDANIDLVPVGLSIVCLGDPRMDDLENCGMGFCLKKDTNNLTGKFYSFPAKEYQYAKFLSGTPPTPTWTYKSIMTM